MTFTNFVILPTPNMWFDLHSLREAKLPTNLLDYNLISNYADAISTLKEDLKEAQSIVKSRVKFLNMAPSVQCTNKTWLVIPWMVEKVAPT